MKTVFTRILCGAALALSALAAAAQPYPSKPIRIIVYVGPGTLVDVTARVVAEKLAETLGQPVVVENMPGAGGLLGIRHVKNAPADGYTLLAATNTVAMAPVLTAAPGYELKDFTAVGGMNRAPFVMVGPVGQPAKSLAELIANAKANPNTLTFASGGVGTTTYLAASMFLHHQAKDGYVIVGAGNQKLWEKFCTDVVHKPEWIQDARFGKVSDRIQHADDLEEMLEQVLAEREAGYWIAKMEEAGIPGGPINSYDQALHDPHVLARDMVLEVEHPKAGRTKALGMPAKMSLTPGQIRLPAPVLGQHTEEVLKGLLALSDRQIAELRARTAI